MGIEAEIQDDVQIVRVDHRLVESADVRRLVETVERALSEGIRKFVIDMEGADWINSAGVSALVSAYRLVQEHEGCLVIARAAPKVEQILVITKLARIFQRYPSVDQAIRGFS